MTRAYCNHGQSTGSGDGSSWDNAFKTMSDCATWLSGASSGDELWVKEHAGIGISPGYQPVVPAGITIHGGFDSSLTGTNGSLSSRTGKTVLLPASGTPILVQSNGSMSRFSFIGTVYSAGYMAGAWSFEDCDFECDCGSSDVLIDTGGSAASITNCTFTDCIANAITSGSLSASLSVTGMTVSGCTFAASSFNMLAPDVLVDKSKIIGNTCGYGTMIIGGGSAIVRNTLICDNQASSYSGGIYYFNTTTSRTINCTIVNNAVLEGGGVVGGISSSGTSYCHNSILRGNTAVDGTVVHVNFVDMSGIQCVDYCDVPSSGLNYPNMYGTHNVDIDPGFSEDISDPYSLSSDTPESVKTGASSSVTGYAEYDVLGEDRGSNPSIGAYEYISTGIVCTIASTITVSNTMPVKTGRRMGAIGGAVSVSSTMAPTTGRRCGAVGGTVSVSNALPVKTGRRLGAIGGTIVVNGGFRFFNRRRKQGNKRLVVWRKH